VASGRVDLVSEEEISEGIPAKDADLSRLRWQSPGEAGARSDLDLLRNAMAANEVVTVREPPDPPRRPLPRSSSLEWT
jgi:hypothetical protein